MTSNVTEVIDKLAEKVGIAATKLTPVAEEILRQVSARGMAYIICGGAVFLLGLGFWVASIMFSRRGEIDDGGPAICYGSVGFLACIAGLALLVEGLSQHIAPLPHILGL